MVAHFPKGCPGLPPSSRTGQGGQGGSEQQQCETHTSVIMPFWLQRTCAQRQWGSCCGLWSCQPSQPDNHAASSSCSAARSRRMTAPAQVGEDWGCKVCWRSARGMYPRVAGRSRQGEEWGTGRGQYGEQGNTSNHGSRGIRAQMWPADAQCGCSSLRCTKMQCSVWQQQEPHRQCCSGDYHTRNAVQTSERP